VERKCLLQLGVGLAAPPLLHERLGGAQAREGANSAPSAAPQRLQKRAPSGFSWPQAEQTGSIGKGYE
jgi:hypothetical protein